MKPCEILKAAVVGVALVGLIVAQRFAFLLPEKRDWK